MARGIEVLQAGKMTICKEFESRIRAESASRERYIYEASQGQSQTTLVGDSGCWADRPAGNI
jgi:hypothetical protein